MENEVLSLILAFLLIGNINLEIGKFKLKFSGIIYRIFLALF